MKYNKHLVVVGTARSGTSWLCETIASQRRYRLLFEPEQETETAKGYLLCDKWLRLKGQSLEADTYLKQIFTNRVDSNWIAQNSNRRFKQHLWPFLPKKYIIKFVRGNLLAKYINEVYDIPVIHIIRNPYNVIESQQNVKFPWLYDLSHFIGQEELVDLIKINYNLDITTPNRFSKCAKLALRWCIENIVPLELVDSYNGKNKVIRYEDLIKDVNVLLELYKEFNLKPVDDLGSLYKKPSSKTHPTKNTLKINQNKNSTIEDQNDISKILSLFNCTLYPIKPLQ